MAEVNGCCDPGFERVRDVLAANIDGHAEIGAALFVSVHGRPVVDLWGGWRDVQRTIPWTADTLVNVFSTTKDAVSLALLMLIDRGEVDPYAPVIRYWPEFGQNGKQDVEVRHLLSHSSGVSGWEQPFSVEDHYDLEKSTARLAAQAPWWEPGTASGYHASNFGHLIGEVIRRVTGKTLGRFVTEEIARPLDADFHIGVDDADFPRVAELNPPVGEEIPSVTPASLFPDLDSVFAKTIAGCMAGQTPNPAATANTPEWRRAEIGGVNGHCSARGLGRILTAVTNGGVAEGVRLLTPKTVDLIFEEQINTVDLVVGAPVRWGMGYALTPEDASPTGDMTFLRPSERTCYWGGWGGSMGIMDVGRGVTVSYVMNQVQPMHSMNVLRAQYYDAIYTSLDETSVA